MILYNMIEFIKQHHPHMRDEEIKHLLNRASDDFTMKSELIKTRFILSDVILDEDDTTIANQRYYKLPEGLFKINEVFLNGVRIPRLIGKPIIDDTTEEEDNI